ncbi:MAG: protocatechuate 3,4-dioxygenase subunit alpha [Acidobacteriota bacterium]
MRLIPSASQTVGPFFNFGLTTNPGLGIMAPDGVAGEHITLAFRVIDGEGLPTPGDSMIELWQADSQGRYRHPVDPRCAAADANFFGFGRLETDPNGVCVFETVKPGRVPNGEGAVQAPHINVTLFGRGLGKPLRTRVYFAGEVANADDPVLSLVPADRRETLFAKPVTGQANAWAFEIHLQGEAETVFFDV